MTAHVVFDHRGGIVIPERIQTSPAAGKHRRRGRRYQRVAIRCGCWLEHEEATVFGTTVDLAEGGLFLRTALPMSPGSVVDVMLQLPGRAEPVQARGTIARRVAPADDGRPGLGVEFVELSRGASELARLLGREAG